MSWNTIWYTALGVSAIFASIKIKNFCCFFREEWELYRVQTHREQIHQEHQKEEQQQNLPLLVDDLECRKYLADQIKLIIDEYDLSEMVEINIRIDGDHMYNYLVSLTYTGYPDKVRISIHKISEGYAINHSPKKLSEIVKCSSLEELNKSILDVVFYPEIMKFPGRMTKSSYKR